MQSKESFIKSQETVVNGMRNSMKRQPGISEADMIPQYKETVKEKNRQIKVDSIKSRA